MKKNNKKLIKRIGCLVGAFMVALVSICSIIPNKKQKIDYASADFFESTYTSNLLPYSFLISPLSTGGSAFIQSGLVSFSFFNTSDGKINFSLYWSLFDNSVSYLSDFVVVNFTSGNFGTPFWLHCDNLDGGTDLYIKVNFSLDTGFSVSSLSSVKISTSSGGHTSLIYSDSSVLEFGISLDGNSNTEIRYSTIDPVVFEIVNPNSSEYSQGYAQGFTAGEISGYNEGKSVGFAEGENVGYTDGYGKGKADGLALGSDYNFMSLFSAIFDAPVQALTGLLNFEILGVNLYNFVTALFTLGLILALIKLLI